MSASPNPERTPHEAAGESAPKRPRRGIYLLPNLLTTASLFSGFYAIVAAIDKHFAPAGIAVFVAMVFDSLDGRIARLTRTETSFGKEYDSLSDMVSFGLAPAIVAYQWGVVRIAEYGGAWGRFGWLACFFYAVAAALRLARFNIRTVVDKRYFEGLPSPSAAATVAGFVWLSSQWHQPGLTGLIIAFAVTALAGALMVSRFSYFSFKKLDLEGPVRFISLLLAVLAFVLIASDPPLILLAIFGGYAVSGPIVWFWRRIRRHRRPVREGRA